MWKGIGFIFLIVVSVAGILSSDPKAQTPQEANTINNRYQGTIHKVYDVGGDSNASRFYDSELKVWCWKTGENQGGLSCIPEWQLEDPYSRVDPSERNDNNDG